MYCSKKCADVAKKGIPMTLEQRAMRGLPPPAQCVCEQCGKEFLIKACRAAKRKYCSQSCRVAAYNRVETICPICGKNFILTQAEIRAGVKHCSMECGKKSLRGKELSKETKQKISEAHKGTKHPWMVEVCKRRAGPLSNLWKGGITPENAKIRSSQAMQEWRNGVFERDDYMCGFCGQRGGRLQADHIRPFNLYPEFRFDTGNGQTLCKECHTKKTNLDRIWYENFTTRL